MDSNSTMDDVGDESHGITVGSGSQGQPEAEPLLISAQHEMLADEPSRAIKLDDRMKTVGRTWLLAAGPSILVCLFAIDFDMLFLSTNYSRRIASDLHELDNAVWVILVGSIMETASNPFYSSVAELLGRRRAALLAAFLTMLGFLFCSLSGQLWHLILARLVVGSGCAGFPLLVAIMLTDTVPLRDFALWRSLIVCAQAVGDLTGGPAGSTLAEKLGWHVVFRLEFIVMAIGLALAFFTLHLPTEPDQREHTSTSSEGLDGLGIILIFTTIALPLFALNTGGTILPWSHPVVIALLACTPFAAGACYWSQTRRGASPLVRTESFQSRPILAVMTCVFFLVYSFNALLYNLGLYIEARSFNSPSSFGDWVLSCIVVARPLGAVLSGLAIKRYREPWWMLRAILLLYFCLYLPIAAGLVRLERPEYAPYLFLLGLSIGLSENCLVVSLLSATEKKGRPPILAIFNVVIALAGDIGVGLALSLTQAFIRAGLKARLGDTTDTAKIIQQAVKSLENIRDFPHDLQSKVIDTFISAIEKVLVISCAAFLIGLVTVLLTRVNYEDGTELEEFRDGEDGH